MTTRLPLTAGQATIRFNRLQEMCTAKGEVKMGWKDMEVAPKDGTHILAVLHRSRTEDMDGAVWPAFYEVREIWYAPMKIMGMLLPWHAGDPFDTEEGAESHYGEDVPIGWLAMETVPSPMCTAKG